MMPVFWVVFCPVLPLLALCSGPDNCTIHEVSSENVSLVLESLKCHNDYQSYVHCSWREGPHTHTPLELWVWDRTGNSESRCTPFGPPVRHADQYRTVQCRYETQSFAIGISHTFFFKNGTLPSCSSASHRPVELSQYLRARPPANLTAHAADGGGRLLRWSSPYAPSSPLSQHLTYQLSYRRERQDDWTTENVTSTRMVIQATSLCAGCRYEARVRARGKVGQWSDWSPLVTWQTAGSLEEVPSLQCVLHGEKEVMCSWEVRRDLAHFITYQLACRDNQTAPSESCCADSTVSADIRETTLRYSCSLTVPDPARLLLELKPMRNAKTFATYQHIQPNAPLKVRLTEKEGNWMVQWAEPDTASKLKLYYQVQYFNTENQERPILQTIPEGSKSFIIPGQSLAPSQCYQVQVRSLVVPGEGPSYEGTASEWTEPLEWTSHRASWSLSSLLYIVISVVAAIGFLILFFSITACKRRALLWEESVPSPDKSKVLSDIKVANSWNFIQNDNAYISKEQNLDSFPTWSSEVLLWLTKDVENKGLELCEDEVCQDGDDLPSLVEKVNSSETSAMSFSGPYILCQSESETTQESVDVQCKDTEEDTFSGSFAPPSPEDFALSISGSSEGYVCLPGHSLSRSTEDLISRSDKRSADEMHDSGDHDSQDPDLTPQPGKQDVQPGRDVPATAGEPPCYTSCSYTAWPQGGSPQTSGYCILP